MSLQEVFRRMCAYLSTIGNGSFLWIIVFDAEFSHQIFDIVSLRGWHD